MIKKQLRQVSYYSDKVARLAKTHGAYLDITSREIERLDKRYKKTVKRILPMCYKTNIKKRDQRAVLSYTRDTWINNLSESAGYTFKCPRIVVNPYEIAPLTAVVIFQTKELCKVRFTVEGNDPAHDISDETDWAMNHNVPIYGLYPGKKNKVVLELTYKESGKSVKKAVYIQTEELELSLCGMIQEKRYFVKSGVPLAYITGGEMHPFAFDDQLEIRHYFKIATSSYGIFPLKNGRFLWGEREIGVPTFANAHTCQLHEIDLLGRIHRTLMVDKGIHHFAEELPNGNIISIGNTLDGCTEDEIVEIDRQTGKIVREIDLRTLVGSEYRDMVDWVHPNALQYNEKEDSLLICMRNVHSVMKINWTTLEVLWVLSIPEFWEGKALEKHVLKPIGDVRWNYQAHAAHEVKDLIDAREGMRYYMVFDNHRINRRPSKQYNEAEGSFINIFEVDEDKKTVALWKQFAIPLSRIRSNAFYDRKSNHVFAMAGCLDAKYKEIRGKVLEIDYKTERVVNSCAIQKDFFSGYPFVPAYKELSKPLAHANDYMIGELSPLVEVKDMIGSKEFEMESDVISSCIIREDFLYIKAKDHAIKKLVFKGNEHCFEKDYTNTHQTNPFHKERKFYMVIPLDNLLEDEYELVIMSEGNYYSTKYRIEVNKGE